jgi:hypothetical protein
MLLANPVLTYPLFWHSILKKEKRVHKRKKTKRRSNTNKVNKQDKRGTEKRERGGTQREGHQETREAIL